MNINPKYFLILTFVVISIACKSVPKQTLYQTDIGLDYTISNDTLLIKTPNPLLTPIRVTASSKTESIDRVLKMDFPKTLPPKTDSSFVYIIPNISPKTKISFSASFGDLKRKIDLNKLSLPFPKGKTYKIIQGYNGQFSHQSTYSKHALDFNFIIGDTVTAADDGYVVGVIEGYKDGGNSKKWRDYANYITLYHAHSGIFTQYVHLVHNGSFVEVGDTVKMGEPIGLSGNTGFSSVEHLHFNVLVPGKSGFISFPIHFIEGYDGRELNKGMEVKK